MEHKDDIRKELSELAPRFGSMEKKNPFSVPDFYFQSLPDRLLTRVKNEPQPWTERFETFLNRLFNRIFQPRYALTFATCLVLLAVSVGVLKQRNQPEAAPQLSEISTEAIDEYILTDFDDYELAVLNGAAVPENADAFIPQNISNEELINYVNDNIDNQTIEEEFL